MNEQVISILTFVVLCLYVIVDKMILPKANPETIKEATETVTVAMSLAQKLDIVFKMASKFVVLAKTEMKDATGEEKRNWVIDKLKKICDGLELVLDDDDLKAINEGAYNDMKKDLPTETIEK